MRLEYKTTPFNHQVKGLKKLLRNNGGGLFMEMGTGKTKVALDFIMVRYHTKGTRRALVVCPKSVLAVWPGEIRKHLAVKNHQTIVYERMTEVDRPTDDPNCLQIVVINYDKLIQTPHFNDIQLWLAGDPEGVMVCDESHLIKNPMSQRSAMAYQMGANVPSRVFLTGTPISKNPLDLFGQFRFFDRMIFGTSYTAFKRQFAIEDDKVILRFINLKTLKKKIKPWIFQAYKDKCLDLPQRRDVEVPVVMARKQAKLYDEMAKEAVLEFKGRTVVADLVVTRMLRLSQMAGGWIQGEDEAGKFKHRIENAKLKVFEDLLRGMWEQGRPKVVVFCRFRGEIADVSRAAEKMGWKVLPLYGSVPTALREQRIAHFDESDERCVFVAQIATGSMGISLVAASEAIFYSHTYSWGEYSQAKDRLHRIGQHHPVTYYHLVVRGTVDETVRLALTQKRDLSDFVLDHPRFVTGVTNAT